MLKIQSKLLVLKSKILKLLCICSPPHLVIPPKIVYFEVLSMFPEHFLLICSLISWLSEPAICILDRMFIKPKCLESNLRMPPGDQIFAICSILTFRISLPLSKAQSNIVIKGLRKNRLHSRLLQYAHMKGKVEIFCHTFKSYKL